MKSCTCCNICAVNKFQNLHFPLCSECVKQMNQSVNVLKLLVKKKKSTRDCVHVSVGLNVVYLKLYTGSDQPERQAGTCTITPVMRS